LYKLIPIPDRDQTLRARINEWKEDIHLIISKYSDEQFSYTKNLLVLFIVIATLLLNYWFQFATNGLLVSFCISIVPFVVLKKSTKEKDILS
jgi:membrane protein required for beta-lactamase induction